MLLKKLFLIKKCFQMYDSKVIIEYFGCWLPYTLLFDSVSIDVFFQRFLVFCCNEVWRLCNMKSGLVNVCKSLVLRLMVEKTQKCHYNHFITQVILSKLVLSHSILTFWSKIYILWLFRFKVACLIKIIFFMDWFYYNLVILIT